jgi:hypothetical protein
LKWRRSMDSELEDRLTIEFGTLATKLDEALALLARLVEQTRPKPKGRPYKQPGVPTPGLQKAIEFLEGLREEYGNEVPASEVFAEAQAAGINSAYLQSAKREMGIRSIHRGHRSWSWVLDAPKVTQWVTHPTRGISVPFDSLTKEEQALVVGDGGDTNTGDHRPTSNVIAQGEGEPSEPTDGRSRLEPSRVAPPPPVLAVAALPQHADNWVPGQVPIPFPEKEKA